MAIQTIAMPLYTVNPTTADVKGALINGAGRALQEAYLAASLFRGYGSPGSVISGFVLPTSGSRTANTITSGEAIVGGYYVTGTDTTTVTFEDAATSWVWLQLSTSSGLATAAQLYVVSGATKPTTPTAPAVFLGRVVTSGGNVTSAVDGRKTGRVVYGSVASDATIAAVGSGDWTVASGGTGVYNITVDSGVFLTAPTILTSIVPPLGSDVEYTEKTSASATAIVITGRSQTRAAISVNFDFMAIG